MLREEAAKIADGGDPKWDALLTPVIEAAMRSNKTFVAVLGTQLLAKATDLDVDTLSLKVRAGGSGSYSARALAKDVLAAEAIALGIHLGVPAGSH